MGVFDSISINPSLSFFHSIFKRVLLFLAWPSKNCSLDIIQIFCLKTSKRLFYLQYLTQSLFHLNLKSTGYPENQASTFPQVIQDSKSTTSLNSSFLHILVFSLRFVSFVALCFLSKDDKQELHILTPLERLLFCKQLCKHILKIW